MRIGKANWLLIRSLTSVLILLGSFGSSFAQDSTHADSATEKTLIEGEAAVPGEEKQKTEQEREAQALENVAKEKAKEQAELKKQAESSQTKPPKEVFKPTEEISEDLPVPFPVDI